MSILDVIIEIPYGSSCKYEFDEKLGCMRLDRILSTAMNYPGNYGYIPKTLAGDGDPLDVLVVSDKSMFPGVVCQCKILGALVTEDEKGLDQKLIAIPSSKVDARMAKVNDLEHLPEVTLEIIKDFFTHYKNQEKGKWVKVGDIMNLEETLLLIDECKKKWNNYNY